MTPLGRGGMSSVWVAERADGLIKRRVALKLPHVSWASPDLAQRMARERDILASLEHPGIARLYDAGVAEDGRPYLALELVDGKPIDEYCALHDADIQARVAIGLQAARAVAYAHSRMVVHRDLKPSNILVDAAGQVRLLDFGIGKLLEENPGLGPQATQFGARAYTPDYASPEQIRGEPVTASTDVYSLGVVLYQLLTGSLPYLSRAPGNAHRRSRVERRSTAPERGGTRPRNRPGAARRSGHHVLKTLKGAKAERYPDMQALADDLDRYLRGAPVLARRDSAWYRLRKFAARNRFALRAAAAAVAVTVAVSAGLAIQRSRQQKAETVAAIENYADNMAQLAVPQTPPTKDVVAYREYLRARGLMVVPTEDNLREAIRLTEDAIARDPQFARAFAVLAGVNLMHLDNGYSRPEALSLAEAAARRALALAPHHPGAHASMGVIAAHRGDWLAAEAHFKSAFEYDDGSGRIPARHAEAVLISTGRRARSTARLPVGTSQNTRAFPRCHAGGRRAGRATRQRRGGVALYRHRDQSRLAGRFARRGGTQQRDSKARGSVRRGSRASGNDITCRGAAGRRSRGGTPAAQSPGRSGRASQCHRRTRRAERSGSGVRNGLVCHADALHELVHHAGRSRPRLSSRAIAGWRQSRRSGLSGIPFNFGFWLPEMRPFRADPRFQELARHMGFIAYWREIRLRRTIASCEAARSRVAESAMAS